MTRVELALILKTIDSHTTKYAYIDGPDIVRIDDVDKLKKDISSSMSS